MAAGSGSAVASGEPTPRTRRNDTMHEALQRNVFLVKEHVGMFKAANNYDIYDPSTGDVILECREENLGIFAKLFRFVCPSNYIPGKQSWGAY